MKTAVDDRDCFLGQPRCVVCGVTEPLNCCYIIPQSETKTWTMLKNHCWVPPQSKDKPRHEPRNGLIMCGNHQVLFDRLFFYIRFIPDIQNFVFINFSDDKSLRIFNNKLIGLDPQDQHSPFPSIFIIHEMRVRAHYPFTSDPSDLVSEYSWSDWIPKHGVLSKSKDNKCYFERSAPPRSPPSSVSLQPSLPSLPTIMGGGGGGPMALNNDVIAKILAATRAMPSWKACQMENTSWEGTSDENTKR